MTNSCALVPFSIWIAKFEKDKSSKGILARWFNGSEFRQVCTKDLFISRMKKRGCTEFLIETFESAWNEFEKVPNARISIITKSCYGRSYRNRLDYG